MVAWIRCVVRVATKPRRWKKTKKNRSRKKAPRLYIPKFWGILRPEMVRLAMICVQIKDRCRLMLKLCSWWKLPPLASAKYASQMMEAGSSQVSYLFMIWYISRWLALWLEVWIRLEWRLLPWGVAGGCGPGRDLGIFYCLVWYEKLGGRIMASWKGLESRRLELNPQRKRGLRHLDSHWHLFCQYSLK